MREPQRRAHEWPRRPGNHRQSDGCARYRSAVGFERTFHGRPAGFRTHSLVCIASAILMIVTVYQNQWMTFVEHDAIRTDPTRMAQGIMTGIGFLGAGVIFKEG